MSIARDFRFLSLLHGTPADQLDELINSPGCSALRAALSEFNWLDALGGPREELCQGIKSILNVYLDRAHGFEDEEMHVNEPLGRLLSELTTLVDDVNDNPIPLLSTVARGIIGQGKLHPEFESTHQVSLLLSVHKKFIRWGLDMVGPESVQAPYTLVRIANTVIFLDNVMAMLETYLTCKDNPDCSEEDLLGELPMNEDELITPEDSYAGVDDQMDHALTIVDGMEGFLCQNNDHTNLSHSQRYLHGVLYAQGHVAQFRDGMEGKIMDSIKKTATNAWNALVNALKAIKDFFFGKADQETQTATLAIADKNKETLQASDNKGAEIKDTAKQGLLKLAEESDESGAFKQAASQLETVADAPSVLDKLKGLMNKAVGENSALRNLYNAAEKKVNDLKAAMTKGDSVNDDDKEGAAAAKQEIQAAMSEAKESLEEAKKAMSVHKRLMNGLRKAMLNITMGIFMITKSGQQATA